MSFEGLKLGAPVRLKLIQPGLQGHHRLRPQPEDPHPRIARGPLVSDDAGLQQHPQVTAHCRGGRARGGGKLPGAVRAGPEQLHDLPSGRVGQGTEQRRHVGIGWCSCIHATIISFIINNCQVCLEMSEAPATLAGRPAGALAASGGSGLGSATVRTAR